MKKKKKVALIFGPNGQDAYYLNKILIENKINVYGISLNKAKKNNFKILYIEKFNEKLITKTLKKIKPHYIFNLLSVSSKKEATDDIMKCEIFNNFYNLIILNSIRNSDIKIKYFLALSGMLFSGKKISHNSKPDPLIHPYSIAKYSAYNYLKYFNTNFKMFCCSAFFFNHESKLRDQRFITRKIINRLKFPNKHQLLVLNNLEDLVDWGHAHDYMRAAYKIITQKTPSHEIIATGKNYSLKYFIELSCKYLNVKYKWLITKNQIYLKDIKKKRILLKSKLKKDKKKIIINMKKTKKKLKWEPYYRFNEIVKEMCFN